MIQWKVIGAAASALALAGCGGSRPGAPVAPPQATQPAGSPHAGPSSEGSKDGGEVAAERAKLSPEDRAAVDAQEWCAVSTDERLGAMGPPLKLDINGRPVFVCCKGCMRRAEADPDKTLATVAGLKAKKAAGPAR